MQRETGDNETTHCCNVEGEWWHVLVLRLGAEVSDFGEVNHVAFLSTWVVERGVPVLGVVAQEVALARVVEHKVALCAFVRWGRIGSVSTTKSWRCTRSTRPNNNTTCARIHTLIQDLVVPPFFSSHPLCFTTLSQWPLTVWRGVAVWLLLNRLFLRCVGRAAGNSSNARQTGRATKDTPGPLLLAARLTSNGLVVFVHDF